VTALPVAASMAHTRQAILDGALRAVAAAQGTDGVTMTQIAREAGVAKATLYNHFRAKDDVWSALAQRELDVLAAALVSGAAVDLPDALTGTALAVGAHPGRAAVADQALLAGWLTASEAVRRALVAAGWPDDPAGADLVLRWLVSQLSRPGDEPTVRAQAAVLAAGLRG
jgi:AcrR family transcriptional regulator